ncbi:MAG: hypothetical protein ABI846_03855 [Rudaea sp.]
MRTAKVHMLTLALAALVVATAGCQKQDPASVVQRRAAERWNLLVSHEPIKAYDYLSPGYRATHTLDQYVAFIATARVHWKAAAIDNQKCDAESCTVSLTVKSVIPGQIVNAPHDVEHEAPITEHWILSEGQWYFLPDTRLEPAAPAGAGQPQRTQAGSPAADAVQPGQPPASLAH